MKLAKLLEIVKTGSVDQDDATRSFISGEIVEMMPRKNEVGASRLPIFEINKVLLVSV